jgi:hypothetical protein
LLLGVLNSSGALEGRVEYVTVRDKGGQIVSCQAKARAALRNKLPKLMLT